MIHFAIDLGQSSLKMKSSKAEYSYPSAYLPLDQILPVGMPSIPVLGDNHTYQLSSEDEAFVWGEGLAEYQLPDKMIKGYVRSDRFNQKKVQRLLQFALGRLAKDYLTESSRSLVIYLQIGVTMSELLNEKNIINLKKILIGKHVIKVDNREIEIEIPNEENIMIMPEYMGTIIDRSIDNSGEYKSQFIQENIGIIDIGGGTILASRSNAQISSPIFSERFEGTQTLIKTVALETGIVKEYQIEDILKTGRRLGKFEYKVNHNRSIDITEKVNRSIDKYTRNIVAPFITESFPDLDGLDGILLTGGGANLLSKEVLFDEIGDDYFQSLIFIEDSEMANVRGFFKSGIVFLSAKEEMDETENNLKELKNDTQDFND